MTKSESLDKAAQEFGYCDYLTAIKERSKASSKHTVTELLLRSLDIYAESKAKEAYNQGVMDAAGNAKILMKKKSQHKANAKWSLVKEDEVDLFQYEVQYSVDKQSILKLLKP